MGFYSQFPAFNWIIRQPGLSWLKWLLAALVITGAYIVGKRMLKPVYRLDETELKRSLLFLLLILPLSFLARFHLTPDTVITSTGQLARPVIFLLGLVPVFLSIGFSGPHISLILSVITGLLHSLIFTKEPLYVLYYGVSVLLVCYFHQKNWPRGNQKYFPLQVLAAFVSLLPLIFFFQLSNQTVGTVLKLSKVINETLLITASMLPGALTAGGAGLIAMRFAEKDWQPGKYLRLLEEDDPAKYALEQIRQVAYQDPDVLEIAKPKGPGEEIIYKSLLDLKKTLQSRSEAQARLLSLDPAQYSKQEYDFVLNAVLRAALGREASCSRLVLLDKAQNNREGMRLRIGQGENAKLYAYLDALILQKMENQTQLVLNDLKVDQYFGVDPENPYPHALIALRIEGEERMAGVLWVGFDEPHWFSPEDIKFYQQLGQRASAILNTRESISQVQAEKDWLNAAMDQLPDPTFLLNEESKIIFLNKLAYQLLQNYPDLAKGSGELKVIGHEELRSLMRGSGAESKEMVLNLEGKEFQSIAVPVAVSAERKGRLLIIRDTSWMKKVSAEKSEFVTNISHDLRSPLTLMKGYLSLLNNIGNLSDEQQKYVERIQASIENMSRLVNKVMSLERLDEEDGVKYSTFDVNEMINETISMLGLQAQQKKVTLHSDTGGLKSPYITADAVLLQQALFNLVENAIKYSPRGGAVLISANKDSRWLHLAVQDRGKGIAPLDQPKLFKRYFHVDNDEDVFTRGQGLGLAIAKSITEKHGGKIWVKSQLGEGSVFFMDIPLRPRTDREASSDFGQKRPLK